MTPSPARAGLSLFELLIALALLALIGTGLASALGLGVRLNDRTAALSENAPEIARRIRLRALLEAAAPPSQIAPFPVSFEGTESGFAFTTLAMPEVFPSSAALRVSVRAEDRAIVLQLQAIDDGGGEVGLLTDLLASEAEGIAFGYLDTTPDPIWRETWESEAMLPALVRITVDGESTPLWPEFTVRPIMADQPLD